MVRALRWLWLVACAGCTTPATEVLCTVDTNLATGTPFTFRVSAAREATDEGMTQWDRAWHGGDGGTVFPASFAIVPAPGQRPDETVLLTAEAVTPTFTLRRMASFHFVSGQTLRLRLFLNAGCAQHVAGCVEVPDGACTQQQLCEEHHQTCNEQAQCADITVAPQPADASTSEMDATFEDALEAGLAGDIATMDAAVDVPAPTDTPPPPPPPPDVPPPPPPPPPCRTHVTYGPLWIHPSGHPAQFDDATALVTWNGACADGSSNSNATLSNGWRPYFSARGGCLIDLDSSNCAGAPTACGTRVTYGSAWQHPSGHNAQYDDVAGRITWDRVCHTVGTSSYAVLSNGWRPYFSGAGACEISLRYTQCGP